MEENPRFVNRLFSAVKPLASSSLHQGLAFENCTFEGCAFARRLGTFEDPMRWATIRRLSVKSCKARGCSLGPIFLEDSIVDGLDVEHLHVWGAVYQRLTLRGRIGGLVLDDRVAVPHGETKEISDRCWAFHRAHYARQTDWAIDISQAEFTKEIDVRGIPARLIRRDRETQAVVKRINAAARRDRQLLPEDSPWIAIIDRLFDPSWDQEDALLVAPRRYRHFKKWLEGIRILRDAGIADPD
ncbi:MAG: hypothetical protein HYV09_34050 [Deltaproteobacteria bacterium]|nr:hypothetical protein [Deltaproteobacteria bacterium]